MRIVSFILVGFFLGLMQVEASLESLAANSPFVPADYKPAGPARPTSAPAPKHNSKLELRGAVELDGQWQFSLFDVQKKKSYWVVQGDPKAPIRILNFTTNPTSVTIDGATGPQTIELKNPSLGAALPIAKGPATSIPPPSAANKNTGKAPRKPTQEDLQLLEELMMLEELLMNAPQKPKSS